MESTDRKQTEERAEAILAELKANGTSTVNPEEWTQTLSWVLSQKLEHHEKLQIIPLAEQELRLSYPKYLFDRPVYPERSFWRKFLPIAIFCVAYFVLCYMLGDGLHRLVSFYFLIGIPFLIGALVSYAMNASEPSTFAETNKVILGLIVLILITSVFALKEGSICMVLASPLLWLGMTLGALLMHHLCRRLWKPYKAVYSLVALPLLFLVTPEQLHDYFGHTRKSVVINAPAAQIWQHLNQASRIQPQEVKDAMMYKIGVPYPVSGITRHSAEGLIRYSTWQKGIHFEELIDVWKPNEYVHWNYRFGPDSVPKGALDDHVTIGGKHFDLLDTSYRLTALNAQQTQLEIDVNYRVSTDMNFYTGFVADVLIADFATVILDFYKVRSEAGNAVAVH